MWLLYLCMALATDGLALLLSFCIWRGGYGLALALLPLALVLCGRLVFVARSFRSAARLRPLALAAAYPQTLAERRRSFLREFLAMWRMFGVSMPLPGCLRRNGAGLPVLFVHGFICNGAVWRPLMRWLSRASGAPLRAISLYPVLGNINDYAAQLDREIEDFCRTTGAAQVMLVGHSMGGLVIRRYLHGHGAARVRRIVTLGSPHQGVYVPTDMARRGANLGQMKWRSAWLTELNAHQAQDCPVPILSLWSPHDNVCSPQDTSRLAYPNARERVLPGEGHDTLLYSQPVWDIVLEEWRAA